jgi:hypothetical protein
VFHQIGEICCRAGGRSRFLRRCRGRGGTAPCIRDLDNGLRGKSLETMDVASEGKQNFNCSCSSIQIEATYPTDLVEETINVYKLFRRKIHLEENLDNLCADKIIILKQILQQ